MKDSFQDVYAKHLQHADYGYPLRMPEPMSNLPDYYQDSGLQIGDVGIIDSRGQFDVLFNICKRGDNLLHDPHGVPRNFQPVQHGEVKFSDNAISTGPIHSHGITQVLQSRMADFEFDSSTSSGAILILPQGAMSVELVSPEQFREVAARNALDWYEFAKKRYGDPQFNRSLYLITGFYKARSWSLGSFNKPTDAPGKILARKDDNNPHVYLFEFTFPADRRHSRAEDDRGSINQTVFITGFKITVGSWLPDPIVLKVTESETTWSILVRLFRACLKRIRSFPGGHKQQAVISMEHSPQLSQPFHPSDLINRFLLTKNPNARVAITHDNQWMDMMKEGLTHEVLLQEDYLGTFLTQWYTVSVDSDHGNAIVFLQDKADGTVDSTSSFIARPQGTSLEVSDPRTLDPDVSPPSTPERVSSSTVPEREVPSPITSDLELSISPVPTPSDPRIVITRTCPRFLESSKPDNYLTGIRAQNTFSGLGRMPAGFYVLVQFSGSQRRTRTKSKRPSDGSVEWEDMIVLPSKAFDVVRFTMYASFELEPTLGDGEALYTSESCAQDLVGGTYLITFSSGQLRTAVPVPSLLVTLGRWHSNRLAVTPSVDDSNSDAEESSVLVRETNLGQAALLRYHNEYQRGDLENAICHFECPWHDCALTHPCRAVVLVNLAKARFIDISHQVDPRNADLDELILFYRQALDLRRPGHPDRPATLLQLTQTLLFRYERQGCDESVAVQIDELITELQDFPEGGHERRAADLVLETLKCCRVVNSGSLAELNELVQELKHSTMVPPNDHFDRPYRLINLGTALWKRFGQHDEISDLDQSLGIYKQALQLLPGRHPDKFSVLKTLSSISWRLFEIRGDINFLKELAWLSEEALQIIPEGHPERSYWVTNSTSHLAEMVERLGDVAIEVENYSEAVMQYSHAITLRLALWRLSVG